ncbi:MAG: hypothetical protein HFH37_06630 [Lachnospiraceae bacterium]|nr:hypothetical protein [Lachnospiraceae bacterium]
MNQVIKELYDMEAQAGKIMENAGLSKQKLQEQKKRQMEDINIGIAAELEGRMSILRAQLEEQAKEDIRQLVEQNRQQIDLLDAEYRDNLTTYAQEIVRKITEI